MRREVLFALGLSALCSTGAFGRELNSQFQVGNWNGNAYTDENSDAFAYCAAGVSYRDNSYLIVSVYKDYTWAIGLTNLPMRLPNHGQIQASVTLDNMGPYQLSGSLSPTNGNVLAKFNMPDDSSVVTAFEQAEEMRITLGGRNFEFLLTSTSLLIPALSTCVGNHVPAAPDASASATPTPEPNSDASAARDKLLSQAADDYDKCIQSNMKTLVPYSNESAETLAQVVITKCLDVQRRFTDLSVAMSNTSRAEVERSVNAELEERRKTLVADIVTFRAELTKALATQPSNTNKHGDKDGQGL